MSSAERLSFAQLRIQAKELLRAVREADPDALKRALVYFDTSTDLLLANAQLVIARERGFSSWASLKRALDTAPAPNPTKEFFKAIESNDLDAVTKALGDMPELCASWRQTPHGYWESALHVAAQRGHIPFAKLLLEAGAEIYAVRQGGYPPVSDAHDKRQTEMVEFLLAYSSERDQGPPTFGIGIDIVLAARIGWLDRVRMHVKRDPFAVYRRGCIGESVLHWPAHNNHTEVLAYLLDHGAAIDADEIGLYGGKPLHWAAEHAPDSVGILLRWGANPNARNLMNNEFEGFTPLHMCASQREQCIECARQLLEAGTEPKALDAKGRTALEVAREGRKEEMAAFLETR